MDDWEKKKAETSSFWYMDYQYLRRMLKINSEVRIKRCFVEKLDKAVGKKKSPFNWHILKQNSIIKTVIEGKTNDKNHKGRPIWNLLLG